MDDPKVVDLCGMVALLGLGAHGGVAIGGPGGYGTLAVPAVVSRFEPLAELSHSLDGLLGLATVHLLLVIAGAAALVALVAARTGSRWLAGAAGAVFAAHPIFGEAFVWAPARAPLLALPMLFLAHRALWRARATHGATATRSWIYWAWFVAAGLSWHGAWLYGLVLGLEAWRTQRRTESIGFGLAACAAFVPVVAGGGQAADPGVVAQWTGAVQGIGAGVVAVCAPIALSVDAGIDAYGMNDLGLVPWIGLAVFVGLALLAFAKRTHVWIVGLGLVGLIAALAILPAEEPVLSHARLGLVAAAFATTLALLCTKIAGSFWRTPVVGLVVIGLIALSVMRSSNLTSPAAMWNQAYAQNETLPRTLLAAAQVALDRDDVPNRGHHALVARFTANVSAGAESAGYRARALSLNCEALLRDGSADALLNLATEAITQLQSTGASYQLPQGHARAISQAYRYHGEALEIVAGRAAAVESFRRAELHDGTNVDALVGYARVLAGSGVDEDLTYAAKLLDRAFSIDLRADVARGLARVYVLNNQPTKAFAILDRAERMHGATPALLFARARAHLSGSRNVAKAEEILRRIQEMDPERSHQEAAQLQAEIHVAVGRRQFERARAEEKDASYKDALERFDAAIKASPSHWEADVFAGDALAALRRFDEARARYTKARSHAPWVSRLIARTAVLQAGAILEPSSMDAKQRKLAAGLVADAVNGATRIDMGYTPFDAEIPMLRAVAADLSKPATATRAQALMLASRAILTGDEAEAARELATAQVTGSTGGEDAHLRDAALLLQAILYERSGNLIEAKRNYHDLALRRDDDPLPTLRKLQIDMRIALAYRKTALAFPDEVERLKRSGARVKRIAERVVQYANAYPERLDAQLLAAEADMHQGLWIESMQRLNVQHRLHPDDPTVLRGLATVYMEHHAASGEGDLLRLAGNEVRKALTMDPRDIRALLDQAQIAAKAQDFAKAIRYALEAQRFDPLVRGPATRLLADLHLAKAQRLLEGGQPDHALTAARAARKADPAGSGSYLWEGKIMLAQASNVAKAVRLEQALQIGMRAKELSPFDREVDLFLADIHRQLGFAAMLQMNMRTRNPDPREGKDFASLDEAERAKQLERYDAIRDRDAARKEALRATALMHYDQALALDPRGEDADETQKRASAIRAGGTVARSERLLGAQAAYAKGQKFGYAGESLKAMRAYQEAVALNSRLARAHYWLVRMAYKNLIGVRMDDDAEKRFAERTLSSALRSLHALDALDAEQQFPLRWYWRGQLNKWMYRTYESEASRHAARAAYKRFLALSAGTDVPEVERAQVHLDALTRTGER